MWVGVVLCCVAAAPFFFSFCVFTNEGSETPIDGGVDERQVSLTQKLRLLTRGNTV